MEIGPMENIISGDIARNLAIGYVKNHSKFPYPVPKEQYSIEVYSMDPGINGWNVDLWETHKSEKATTTHMHYLFVSNASHIYPRPHRR